MQHFASDNCAGICPESLSKLLEANAAGPTPSYGDDPWTARACTLIREIFATDCDVFFVFNGTAANSLALASICQPYHSVICHEFAHVETDECGAPEFFSGGAKLLPAPGADGKLTAETVEALIHSRTDLHFPQPKAVTLTQSTESGTLYSVDELKAISAVARANGLRLHMDGARFANAVAALNIHPADLTWCAGIDILSFGGTKNGLPIGEAVVIFDKVLAEDFAYRAKQGGQLASKMRFIAAPWVGLLEKDVWLHHARHGNAMAALLYTELAQLPQLSARPPQANAVFVDIPDAIKSALRAQGWRFHDLIGTTSRLMCSWETQPEIITRFTSAVQQIVAGSRA